VRRRGSRGSRGRGRGRQARHVWSATSPDEMIEEALEALDLDPYVDLLTLSVALVDDPDLPHLLAYRASLQGV
jgi:hypothetical protein